MTCKDRSSGLSTSSMSDEPRCGPRWRGLGGRIKDGLYFTWPIPCRFPLANQHPASGLVGFSPSRGVSVQFSEQVKMVFLPRCFKPCPLGFIKRLRSRLPPPGMARGQPCQFRIGFVRQPREPRPQEGVFNVRSSGPNIRRHPSSFTIQAKSSATMKPNGTPKRQVLCG